MKSILKSLKPKTCANIMNLIQSILVIKDKREATAIQKLIDENEYADIYVYCTKSNKEYLYYDKDFGDYVILSQDFGKLNGKVIFKFRCYKVEELEKRRLFDAPFLSEYIYKDNETSYSFERKTQLTEEELCTYLKNKNGYAIHISDLEIFDKPKWLIDFKTKVYPRHKNCLIKKSITKAPRSFCYVEIE